MDVNNVNGSNIKFNKETLKRRFRSFIRANGCLDLGLDLGLGSDKSFIRENVY